MCASQILSQYVEVTTVDNLVLDKAKEIIFDNARTEEWRYGFLASLRSECSDRNPATGETLSRETATQLFSVNAPNSDDNQCLVRATPPLPPAQPTSTTIHSGILRPYQQFWSAAYYGGTSYSEPNMVPKHRGIHGF